MVTTHTARRPLFARARMLGAIAATLGAVAPTLASTDLQSAINAVIGRTALGPTRIGVCVVDIDTGEQIATFNATRPFIPASNMKLLTSGAALLALGDDFQFRTEIRRQETPAGTRLIVVGSGDPALGDPVLLDQGTPAMDIAGLLDRMAGAVAKRSVTDVAELVLDDRVFDRELAHPTWPNDQLNRWYCAEVSGLNLHTNVVTVYARAQYPAAPAVTLEPDVPWAEFENRAESVRKGDPTAWVSRPRPENAFTLHGKVRSSSAVRVAIHDPTEFTGRVLADALTDNGVQTSGAELRRAADDERFDGAVPLVAVTTNIADVLRRCNADSHNLYAEAMLKRVGHEVTGEPGSWLNGGAVLRMFVAERIGSEHATTIQIADGSGLSRDNRVRPDTMALWAASLASDPDVGPAFIASLPRAGEGTLRARFNDGVMISEIRAKSGYVRGVYSLSGVLIDPRTGDPEVAFSILLNDVPEGSTARKAKPFHEDIVELIDAWLADRAVLAEEPTYGG
ncbi:MAG: peptidase M15 [Phycisphaeraceae bacterium]|nr:MAG: peptidase M15 [Phycisphaeraceae bacterium]